MKLRDNLNAVVDLGVILMIGIAFTAMLVIGYIILKIKDQLIPPYPGISQGVKTDAANASWNETYRETSSLMNNVTGGFDNAFNLILVAITIFILAVAISALLMLRGRGK